MISTKPDKYKYWPKTWNRLAIFRMEVGNFEPIQAPEIPILLQKRSLPSYSPS